MYPFQMMGYGFGPSFGIFAGVGLLVLLLWSIVWKCLALWKAAHRNEPWWFIIFLVINTAGILEIIYLFLITKDGIPNIFEKK